MNIASKAFETWINKAGTGGRSVEDVYERYQDNPRRLIADAVDSGQVTVENRWSVTNGYRRYVVGKDTT